MKIEQIPVKDLKPYERNAKKHDETQVKNVMESIKQFGFAQPLVIDKDNVLIIGHCRLIAAKRLKMNDVPVVRMDDLTPEQVDKLRLLDNKLNESEWDFDLLAEDVPTLDFSDFDIDWELPEEPEEEKEIIEDEVPDVPEEPKAKLGDLYEVGGHRLICGDSTDITVIDRLMDGIKADLVITDPPYGVNIVNDKGKVGADNLAKNGIYAPVIGDDTTDTAEKAYNLLTTICDRLILWGGNYFTQFLPFSDSWIVWDKRVDMEGNNFADGEMGWCSFHTPVRIYHQLWSGMIREGEHEKRVHPTQKPVKMLSEIIKDFSKDRNIIVDVFGGSGSTLIACEETNRKCYMCELSPHYIDVIIQRYINLKGNDADVFLIRDNQRVPYKEL